MLETGRELETTLQLAATTWALFDRLSRRLGGPDAPTAKEEPCPFCCTRDVTASAPEIMVLAHDVRSSMSPDARAALEQRIAGTLAEADRPQSHAVRAATRWCPLSEEDRCWAHEHRPLTCRGWSSVDQATCQADLRDGLMGMREEVVKRFIRDATGGGRGKRDYVSPRALRTFFHPIDADLWTASQIVGVGLREALRRGGLEHEQLGLTRALQIALAAPSLDELNDRWRNGEHVFAEAARSERA